MLNGPCVRRNRPAVPQSEAVRRLSHTRFSGKHIYHPPNDREVVGRSRCVFYRHRQLSLHNGSPFKTDR
jgi:hypothetical protein